MTPLSSVPSFGARAEYIDLQSKNSNWKHIITWAEDFSY